MAEHGMSDPMVLSYATPVLRAPWHRSTLLTLAWAILSAPLIFLLAWLSGTGIILPQHLFCCTAPGLALLLFVGSPVAACLLSILQMLRARRENGGGRNFGIAVAGFVIALLSAVFGFGISQAIRF
jgi:hypothetical protein